MFGRFRVEWTITLFLCMKILGRAEDLTPGAAFQLKERVTDNDNSLILFGWLWGQPQSWKREKKLYILYELRRKTDTSELWALYVLHSTEHSVTEGSQLEPVKAS